MAGVMMLAFLSFSVAEQTSPKDVGLWAHEINNIVKQLADTFMGDNDFLNKFNESCSIEEDPMDGVQIAEEAAESLNKAFKDAMNAEKHFKESVIKEFHINHPKISSDEMAIKNEISSRLDNKTENSLWLSYDVEQENIADVLTDILWTDNAIPHMEELLNKHNIIGDVIIGTTTGVLRIIPGIDLNASSNMLEFRLQSWFIGRSKYEQVIIILDTSTSMGMKEDEYLNYGKEVAVLLVDSFTSNVDFNVISSSSMVWDVQGRTIEQTTTFLLCESTQTCELYPANEQNKKVFIDHIWRLKSRGGTDLHRALDMAFKMFNKVTSCKQTIFIISCGQDRDKRVRCSSGTNHYLEENQKRFMPGDVCKYNVETTIMDSSIMQYSSNYMIKINTIATTESYMFYKRLSRISCENGGISVWINRTRNYYSQFKLYLNDLFYSFDDEEILIETSRLTVDSTLSKLFFTESFFINYSNRTNEYDLANEKEEQMGGVLGFTINFTSLRNLLNGYILGGVYAFLVRADDLIVKCYTGMISVYELSQVELNLRTLLDPRSEMKEFTFIHDVIKSMKSGKVSVTSEPNIPMMSKEEVLVYVPKPAPLEYFFAPIESIGYMLGYIGTGDRVMLTRCLEPPQRSCLHSKLDFLRHTRSAVALLRKAFCDWNSFEIQFDGNESNSLEDEMNSVPSSYHYEPCDGLTTNQAKLEIKATFHLEEIWSKLLPLFNMLVHIKNRFFLTTGGVLRIFPPVVIARETLDSITSHGWYREALENEGRVVFTQQKFSENFLETEELGIFISKTMYFPFNDCNTSTSTTEKCQIFGVFGVTGFLKDTAAMFSKVVGHQFKGCGEKGSKCYMISKNLDVSMQLIFGFGDVKKPINLFKEYPTELEQMTKDKILINRSHPVILRKCFDTENFVHKQKEQGFLFRRIFNSTEREKMKAKSQFERPCLKMSHHLRINDALFSEQNYSNGTMMHTQTKESDIYLSPIISSSSYLLVIFTHTFANRDRLNKTLEDILYADRELKNITQCPLPIFVPLPCSVSGADSFISKGFAIKVTALLLMLLSLG